MDRRKFLGLFGKTAAVAVVAPQVLAEIKSKPDYILKQTGPVTVTYPKGYTWEDSYSQEDFNRLFGQTYKSPTAEELNEIIKKHNDNYFHSINKD